MSPGKSIEDMLTEHVKAFADSERPGEIIAVSVERMFSDLIRETFSSKGQFAATVKGEIARALPSNISEVMDLPRYNDMIVEQLREQWAGSGVTDDVMRRAMDAIHQVLVDDSIPEFVSLRQLLDSFIAANQHKADENRWHSPHISIHESGGIDGRSRSLHILFDAEPENAYRERNELRERTRSDTDYANRLSVKALGTTDRGKEFGEVYTCLIEGLTIGRHYKLSGKWQKFMAALYFGSAKLVVDCDPNEFTYR